MTAFFFDLCHFWCFKVSTFFFWVDLFLPRKKLVAFMIQIDLHRICSNGSTSKHRWVFLCADHQGLTATTWIYFFRNPGTPQNISKYSLAAFVSFWGNCASFQVQRVSSLFGVCLSNVLFACVRRTAFAIPSTNSRCVIIWPRFKISLPRVWFKSIGYCIPENRCWYPRGSRYLTRFGHFRG